MSLNLDAKIPSGPIEQKWEKHRFEMKLVNPANKRRFEVIVVGTGLAGASAAATLGELGYNVKAFCFQDSPRRAHSIAAQGGINAAKNYQNDGDSVHRLFYDTVKGGDFRAREANVHRLAEISVNIIDQCVAQGVPFAREYGGTLANRSFGGAQVSRTFYARGQTGQQLLLGAYQALERQIALGQVVVCAVDFCNDMHVELVELVGLGTMQQQEDGGEEVKVNCRLGQTHKRPLKLRYSDVRSGRTCERPLKLGAECLFEVRIRCGDIFLDTFDDLAQRDVKRLPSFGPFIRGGRQTGFEQLHQFNITIQPGIGFRIRVRIV